MLRSVAPKAAIAAFALAIPAAAQDAPSPSENSITVTAKRSGAPMWFIDSPTGTVVLVGEIRAVPEVTPWQPDRLKDTAKEADRVIIGSRPKFSPGDVLRLIFRGGRFTKLPNKTVAGDYLNTDQRARLAALEEKFDKDYDRSSFFMTGFNLLIRQLDFTDDTLDDDATDIVRKAAKKADIPIARPERFRGEDLLDDLAEAPPESHIPCLEAAMTAAEAGEGIIEKRGRDWTEFDVIGVMDNPLEKALASCWPWADPEVGDEIRSQWTTLITDATKAKGNTLAVVPLRVLAEREGVLDRLEAQGLDIAGPDWKPDRE